MGSSSEVTVGYRYYMGLHFGLCHGPVDEVQEIIVGDRNVWYGAVTDNSTISIDAGELFGGDKKEGGIVGSLDLEMGGAAQTANSYLTSKIGATIPAFRGIFSAVWKGGQVSSNNPYIKPWAFRVKRILQGWSTGTAWYPEAASIMGCMLNSSYAVYIALDCSGSMATITSNGQSRLTNAKTALINVLDYIQSAATLSGVRFDVMIVAWGGAADGSDIMARSSITERSVDAAKITSLKSFVTSRTTAYGTYFPAAVADAAGFFNGSATDARRTSVFITDGEPSAWNGTGWDVTIAQSSVTEASNTLMSISGVYAYAFNIDLTNAASTATMDNTGDDSVPVLDGSNPEAMTASISYVFGVQENMNPAHIIYQCLTDGVWGMGYPTSAIDNDSFTVAADKLYSEAFGLSMIWNEQDTIESFIKIVLDHVGGILYVDPSTGKFALKLIRDDYVKASLPIYGPSNLISASDYQRQAWGETINEISVVYTDGFTGKDASVTVQDLANIQTQGGVVAQTKQYPGVRCVGLAQRVAMRDLIVSSTPLAKIKLTATRKAWSVIPGDVIRLTWPEYGIEDVVYRILEVNRGTLQNGEITIEAVEDVFGMPDNTYVGTQDGGWEEPSNAPASAPYRKLVEAPYWDFVRSLSAAELDYIDPLSGYLETLAVRPSGDALDYEINTKTGSADYAERTTGQFCPSATLTVALTKTTTSITFGNMVDVDLVETGGYAIVDGEYVGITAIDAAVGTATITRGLLDTVPTEHSIGARIWFADGYQGADETEYADGETVDCKILPRTGQGELNISSAPVDSLTMDQRHNRPYPPGKVLVNGSAYPDWIGGADELALTLAHRDRLSQTAYLVTQGEASIGPEAGTTYNLRIYGEADSLIHTYTGLSGTSQTYDNTTELSDGGSATEDPYWSSVKLLLNMNGADNGTTFTDSSATPKTITRYNAVTKTGVKKYGSASGYFDGNGDYLTIPHSEDFNLGSGDFTIELWFNRAGDLRFYNNSYFSVLLAKDTNGSGRTFWLRIYGTSATNAAGLQFAWSPDNGTTFYTALAEHATVIGVWYHLAVSRQAGVVRMYLDGTLVATGNNSVAGLFNSTSAVLSIGRDMWGATEFKGYIDDLRITKGVARYTSNFTPLDQELGRYSYDARLNGRLRFELESVRDGLASYQKHNHEVRRTGYGFNYGMYYG